MKNKKIMAGGVCGIAFIGLLIGTIYQKQSVQIQKNHGLFSWGEEAIQEEEWEQLRGIIEEFQIQAMYQEASKENFDNGSMSSFIQRLREYDVDVYYLTGEREWGLEPDGSSLKKEIEYVWRYNENAVKNQMLKGIMVDIEPYLTKEWRAAAEDEKAGYMKIFVDGMEEAYRLAKEKGLELLVCVPTFYEVFSKQELERLTAKGCDGLAVMNYNRTDETGQIAVEVDFAKKYGKKIISIAELQKPGIHELEEINTYYHVGLPALENSWNAMEEWFQYDKLSFAYHYYTALKKMIE